MRRVGDIMKDLGFREEASDDVKKAFIKNLMKAAYGVQVAGGNDLDKALGSGPTKPTRAGEQLSFDLGASDPVKGLFPKRKSG